MRRFIFKLTRKFTILVLALVIVVVGTSIIGKKLNVSPQINKLKGDVAGAAIDGANKLSLATITTNALATGTYQNVSGDVAVSGKVTVTNSTTSEAEQLKLYNPSDGGTSSQAINFYQGSGTALGGKIISGYSSGFYMAFNAGSGERMRILSAGNVGIGTISPGAKLEVTTADSASTVYALSLTNPNNQTGNGGGTGIKFSTSSGPSGVGMEANKWSSIEAFDVNNYGSNSGLSFTTSLGYTKTKSMVIDRSGKVGIGITTPMNTLDVNGNAQAAGLRATAYTSTGWTGAGAEVAMANGIAYFTGYNRTTPGYIDTYIRGANLMLQTGGVTRLLVSSTGVVTVSAATANTIALDTGNGYVRANGYSSRAGVNGTFGGGNIMNTYWDGSCTHQWIDSYDSGCITTSSDQRIKKNIQSFKDDKGLNAINKLNPVTFNWKNPNSDKNTQYGFLAQEVQKVFPELIKNTGMITDLTPDGMLRIDYNGLIPIAIKGIQEQSRQIGILDEKISSGQTEIKQLQDNNAALESRLKALEAKIQ